MTVKKERYRSCAGVLRYYSGVTSGGSGCFTSRLSAVGILSLSANSFIENSVICPQYRLGIIVMRQRGLYRSLIAIVS